MSKVGLVLEGGGQKGIYTAGVLDCLLDAGIHIGYVIGVSAGAACATAYISGQRGRNYTVYISSAGKRKYLSLMNYFSQGSVFGVKYVYDTLPNGTIPLDYNAADSSGIEYWVVATDCRTGLPFYKRIVNLRNNMRYLMASSAIPLVSRIFKVEGNLLLDGCASDSIPIEKSIADGNDKNIVILTKNKEYRLAEPTPSNRMLTKIAYGRYPGLMNSVLNRHNCYNACLDRLQELETQGKALLVRPTKPFAVSQFEKNKENLISLYNNGYEDATNCLPNIIDFIKDASNAEIKK
ncbi:MAG: patatin family protein [Eubacteriales bacterium]